MDYFRHLLRLLWAHHAEPEAAAATVAGGEAEGGGDEGRDLRTSRVARAFLDDFSRAEALRSQQVFLHAGVVEGTALAYLGSSTS